MLEQRCFSGCRSALAFIVLIFLILTKFNIASAKDFVVAVDHYPPWILTDTEPYSGIDIEILNAVADELSLTIDFVICPLKRCLEMLKTGQVDLLPGLFKTPEREQYLAFIEPPYMEDSAKVFYINKDKRINIEHYDDLKNLTIGVKRGASYFKQFDDDDTLNKFVVRSEVQLFNLLNIGRIDTFISDPLLADYYITQQGVTEHFSKALYSARKSRPSYFALSKNSPLLPRIEEFKQIIKQGVESGKFINIAEDFVKRKEHRIIK